MPVSGIKIISNPLFTFIDSSGRPLSGGKVYTYASGTSTKKTTYSDYNGKIPNANPIILNSSGMAKIYGEGAYKIIVCPASSAVDDISNPIDTIDPYMVVGISDFALTLLDDMNAATARQTLGLGTAAVKNYGNSPGNLLLIDNQGRLPAVDGRNLVNLKYSIRGHLSGMEMTWAQDAITVGAGECWDDAVTDTYGKIKLASAITKTTGAWTAGTGLGGLDTGSLSEGWYHVFVIKKLGNTEAENTYDVIFSASPTSPTMPTEYSGSNVYKRRIGSFRTDATPFHIKEFIQRGNDFWFASPQVEIDGDTYATDSSTSLSIGNIPTNINASGLFNAVAHAAGESTHFSLSFTSSLLTPISKISDDPSRDHSIAFAPPCQVIEMASYTDHRDADASQFSLPFDATPSITLKCYGGATTASGVNVAVLYLYTLGWTDTRGK